MKKTMNKFFVLLIAVSLGWAITASQAVADPSFGSTVPASLRTQVLQDLGAVQSLQGTAGTRIFKTIFGQDNLNGSGLIAFFDARIKTFDLDDCGGGASVAACVIPYESTTTMWITPAYVNANIPQMYRVSIIFHESRHTERAHGYWSHETCPVPYLDDNGKDIVGIVSGAKMAGQPACDNTALGAYGLQATILKNVEKSCTNCNEKTKMDAQLYGDDTINRISDLTAREQLKNDLQGK